VSHSSQLETLTQINIDDFLSAWGLKRFGFARMLAHPAAKTFARDVIAYDDAVGAGGWQAGGATLIQRYAGGLQVAGVENIPREGPTLILSNHPGLTDSVALFASIPRNDLRLIALDRPFLRALPHTWSRIFHLPDDPSQRAGATRLAAHYIKQGGAVLTFPAGRIEPDPLVLDGAVESLASWSASIGLFARLVPQMKIVVAIVGAVLLEEAQRNPLTKLRRLKKDQELLGAALQILWRPYQRNIVRVAFAPPLLAADLLKANSDPAAVTKAVTDEAKRLIETMDRLTYSVLRTS
jgi:1-acyl-sn-glycerol-3-phosphate acyltransferase